ncbi:37S ribosomal protein YMR-31, mitochondrial [Schizosaccharomyces pombe]
MVRKILIDFTKHITKSSLERHPHPAASFPLPASFTTVNSGPAKHSTAPPATPETSILVEDRNELPLRFHRLPVSEAEMQAVESGGAYAF